VEVVDQAPDVVFGEGMKNPIYLNHDYLTRDGHKVRILTTTMKHPNYPVVGLIDHDGVEEPCVWTKTGCFDVDARKRDYDLVKDVTNG